MLKRYRLVLGQQLHPDRARTCAFCNQPYHRRHRVELWEKRRAPSGAIIQIRHTVRLCADEGTGCAQLGLAKLFKGFVNRTPHRVVQRG